MQASARCAMPSVLAVLSQVFMLVVAIALVWSHLWGRIQFLSRPWRQFASAGVVLVLLAQAVSIAVQIIWQVRGIER